MTRRITGVVCAIFSATTAHASTATGHPANRRAAVDRIFAPFARSDTPGCAVGISRNGRVIYRQAYGMADLERGVPLTPDSVFDVGSVAKQFTAACIVLLAEEGKIKFSDPIRRYLPELPALYDPVTIDHLIHHSSGVHDALKLIALIHDGLGAAHISDAEAEVHDNLGDFHLADDEFLDLMARQTVLSFSPGERWQYSNSGYILLALVVQRASGLRLGEFAKQRIFDPLGMHDTKFQHDHAEIIKRRAIGYHSHRNGDGFFTAAASLDVVGDGGLYTTVGDLLRWNRNFDTGAVGGPSLVKTMTTPGKVKGEDHRYATGLFLRSYGGLKTIGHGGGLHAYAAEFLRFPEQQFAVAVLCNTRTNATDAGDYARQIAKLYLGNSMTPDHDASRAKQALPFISVSPAELNEYAGDYHTDELPATYRFVVADGQLQLAGRKSNDPVAHPIGKDEFFYRPGMTLTFTRDVQRQVSGFFISFFPGAHDLTFTRVTKRRSGAVDLARRFRELALKRTAPATSA